MTDLWKHLVNAAVLFYKFTYEVRDLWMDSIDVVASNDMSH